MQDGIGIKHGCWNYLNVVLFDYSLNIMVKWISIRGLFLGCGEVICSKKH